MQLLLDRPFELTDEADTRVADLLNARDRCHLCQAALARLVRRKTPSGWTVRLQCVRCGDGIGPALPRAQHPAWQSYSEWNQSLVEDFLERDRAQAREQLTRQQAAAEAGRLAYVEFLRSPEWRRLRVQVLNRARGICEACLIQPASEVHHTTYELGWMPPAWHLVAICRPCHERFRIPGDRWANL